jgi:metal-dependent hydrolase (beta-lactamase superfamily II)
MLGSGSGGNAVLIECDGSRILIDCGFGTRTLAGRLKAISVAPQSIDACIVTHDHDDHVKGAKGAAKRWGWEVFATHGTARAAGLNGAKVHRFAAGMTIEFPRNHRREHADAARRARIGRVRRDEPFDGCARRTLLRPWTRDARDGQGVRVARHPRARVEP